MVFLELRRDSRVTTGNSGCLLCWPRQGQSSIRVAKESWGLLSSDCRANRPHLGLCPEANVRVQWRQRSRGCIPDAPGETGIHLEWKQRTALCSRVATGISWGSLCGLKGPRRWVHHCYKYCSPLQSDSPAPCLEGAPPGPAGGALVQTGPLHGVPQGQCLSWREQGLGQ